jgi:hypothetical protein
LGGKSNPYKLGLLDENGNIHPNCDWRPERYTREFGQAAQVKFSKVSG